MHKNYNIPSIYQKMNERGYLNRENYLWLNEMEWFPIDAIRKYEHEEGESEAIIPFAMTGAGDKWVWVVNDEEKEYHVGLCECAEWNGVYYAKNTEDAIFRQIIEYVSDSNFYINKGTSESYQVSESELMRQLETWQTCFDGILNKKYLGVIRRLRKLNLKYVKCQYGEWVALLTLDEREELLNKYIKFDLLDEEFAWYVQGSNSADQ